MVLNLNAVLQDTDGSESLAVIIDGVPKGSILSRGIDNGDGTWTLSPTDYAAALAAGGLKLTVVNANATGISHTTVTSNGQTYDQGSVTLTVRPFSIEAEGDRNTSVSDSFVVSWTVAQGSSGGNTGGGNTGGGDPTSPPPPSAAPPPPPPPTPVDPNTGVGVKRPAAVTTGEDTGVALALDSGLSDWQSVTAVTLTGIPSGAVLRDSNGTVITVSGGRATIDPAHLAGVTLTPPANSDADFTLGVTVTSGTGHTQTSLSLPVTVTAIADAAALTVQTATGNEDSPITLAIAAALTDTDGSETLASIVIDGVPTGAKLSAGFEDSTHPGRWVLTPAQAAGLTFTPPADVSGTIQLSVTAVTRETSNADRATVTKTLTVEVAPVSDAPAISVSAPAVPEDHAANLSLAVAVTDLVGSSEVISAVRLTVPAGFTLSAGTALGGGVYDLSGLTAAERAGLSLTPPANYAGTVTLTVDAAAKDGTAAEAWSSKSFSVTFTAVADAPTVTVANATGREDTAIPLTLSAALVDTDGSESMAIILSGLPDGAVLNHGSNNGDGSWVLKPADLAGLTVTPPRNLSGGMDLTLTVTSLESSNKDTASTTASIHVEVTPVADAPAITTANATGREDSPIALNLSAALIDTDGSETLGVVLSGLPSGATLLDAGGHTLTPTNGSISLTAAQLTGLRLNPPANAGTDFTLTLTATATEQATGATATTSQLFRVSVDPVADQPVVTWTPLIGTEDTVVPLNLAVALADTDGSERLGLLTITGVPTGAILSAGTRNADGSWTLTPDQIPGLALTPPANSDAAITLTVAAVSVKSNGTTATTVVTLPITMVAVSDDPTLTVQAASGAEDSPIALSITPALTDTDGSETLTVTLSGIPDGASLHNSAGDTLTITGGSATLTPAQLAGLTITPPSNSDADFTLTVTATAKDGTAAPATLSRTLSVAVSPVTDSPTLTVQPASGTEDTPIALSITPALTDTDGSETLTVTLSGIPSGAVLRNTGGVLTVVGGSVTLTPAQLAGLAITPPSNSDTDFTLTVTATAKDGSASAVSTVGTLAVTVTPVSDTPTLSVTAASGNEDTAIALSISPALTDTDGSETLSVTLSGIPDGATLRNAAGALAVVAGGITLTPSQLSGLTITPPSNSDADFTLTVTATAKDGSAAAVTTTRNLAVTVNPVSDTPTLTVQAASGNEDTAIALSITPALIDTDGSETLTVTLSGIPSGASLHNSAGDTLAISGGSATLTPVQLAGLTITPPSNSDADFTLTVTATAKDGSAAAVTTVGTLAVTVNPVADTPTLTVTPTHGAEDTAIALSILAAPSDGDGSESLTVLIGALPDGASLNHGTRNADGSWSLTAADLSGLTLTPPTDATGPIALSVTVTSHDGVSTATASQTLTVTVDPVNDAPVLTTAHSATVIASTAAANLPVAGEVALTDVDSTTMASMTIRIASGSQSGDQLNLDTLSITTDPGTGRKTVAGTGVEVLWDAANHQLSLTGNASTATYTDILHHLALTPGGTGNRTLEVTVTDQQGGTSDPLAVQILVSGDAAMMGTSGADILHPGSGTSTVSGGAGDDLFIFASRDGNLTIDGGAGWTDVVQMNNFAGGVANWLDQIDQASYTVDPSGHGITFHSEWSGTLHDQNGHDLVLQNIERLTF